MMPDDRPQALFNHHPPIVFPALLPCIIMNAVRQEPIVIATHERLFNSRTAFGIAL